MPRLLTLYRLYRWRIKNLLIAASDGLVNFVQQPVKFWDWSAKWPWFAGFFATAATVFSFGEYAFSVVFLFLSALGLLSKLLHWDGGRTRRASRTVLKVSGSIGISIALAICIYGVDAERDTKPWSHVQLPLEGFVADKWFPLSSEAMEIPRLSPKFGPPRAPDISKSNFSPSQMNGKKKPPAATAVVIPPIHRTDLFTTYVIFNAGDKNNPLVCPGDWLRAMICAEFRDIAKRDFPVNSTALPQFFGIVLQHYIVALVGYAGEGFGMHSESFTGLLREKMTPPIDVPDEETFELNQVLKLTDSDSSLFPPSLIFKHHLRLPRNSAASFVLPTDQRSYVLRLERGGYYKLDLCVSLLLRSERGVRPEGLDLGIVDTSQIITYDYGIELDLTVQRPTDPTFIPSDYVEWGQSLFNNIRRDLEH